MIFAIVAAGCSDSSDEPQPVTPPAPEEGTKTVLVYMVADNNLAANASDDLEEMRRGMQQGGLPAGARLLVFFSGTDHNPRLMEIGADGKEHTLKTYETSPLAVSVERMSGVIADMKAIAPARTYGLVLWSHATGWMSEPGQTLESPTGIREEQPLDPLSFGYDGYYNGRRMKITSLAKALEGTHFEYIYFDCCHMATVEVAYELRHAADRIVGSPTELGVEGMPYDKNIPCLLAGNISNALRNTFEYYREVYEHPDTEENSEKSPYGCAITLIDTRSLDRLATATRAVFESDAVTPPSYVAVPYYRSGTGVRGIFDMYHHIHAICSDPQLLTEWDDAFAAVVTETHTTDEVFMIKAEHFHGLGCHIIRSEFEGRLM